MGKQGQSIFTWVVLLVGLALAFCESRVFAQGSLVLGQARLGNVFLTTESVQIPVQTSGDEVAWVATDFFGAISTGAGIPVGSNGTAVIAPNLGRLGYFDLRVTARRAGNTIATADTAFAVVPPSVVMASSRFGVMTHFAQGWDTDILQLLARAGIAHFRDEQYWQNVEPTRTTPATYTFANYAPYMAAAASLGLQPLTALTFANSNYDGGFTPYTDVGRTGYKSYATALLSRYGPQIGTVEVWNEYNGSFCTGPATANRAQFYTAMLRDTYGAIKAMRPDVQVLGGASVPVPLPWFEDLFAAGALDYMDAVAVHPYRKIPEGVETDLAALQSLMASHNRGAGPKPIWATECGAADDAHQGRQEMARYLVRLMTLIHSAGVERAFWYLARDYDEFTTGLVRSPADSLGRYAPTSAYPAYANLIQQLNGADFLRRENTDFRTRAYVFQRGATEVRVAWSTAGTAQLIFMKSTPLTRVDIMGASTSLQPSDGMIGLAVGADPVFLIGTVATVREIGRDVLVADSARDFSLSQSTSNGAWFYGVSTVAGGAYNPASVQPMASARTAFNYVWNSPFSFSQIDAEGGHPSASGGTPVWVVRRWQSDASGIARIVATARRLASGGDGTGARIYVNGAAIYSTIVGAAGGPDSVQIDISTPIQVGSKIDFVITPGPAASIDFDFLEFRARVSVATAPPATFDAWQGQSFTASEFTDRNISDDNAAPGGSGLSNLLKYAALGNSGASPFAAAPRAGVARLDGNSYLTLSYRRSIAASDLTFTTELNGNELAAGSWNPGGTPFGPPLENGDGTRTITVRDVVPIGSPASPRFMRLRVSRPAPSPTTFSTWQRQNFPVAELSNPSIAGETATPAGDGTPNLLKYALKVGPRSSAMSALPSAGVQRIGNASYLTINYRRSSAAADLIFAAEWNSNDLSAESWTRGGVPLGLPVDNGDGTQSITIRDDVPIASTTPTRFVRMRATRP